MTDEAYEEQRRNDLDGALTAYRELLLTLVLLQYAIKLEMRDSMARGIGMLKDYQKLRDFFKEAYRQICVVFSQEEISASHERTGYHRFVYSQIDAAALRLARMDFGLEPRPVGPEYGCTREQCVEAATQTAHTFFPSLYGLEEH